MCIQVENVYLSGMKPYPLELRQRIVDAVDQQLGTIAEIAEFSAVSERCIYQWLALRHETGSLAPRPHGGGAKPKLDARGRQRLVKLSETYADATLNELRQKFNSRRRTPISISTVCRGLLQLTQTRKKKSRRAREADPLERDAFTAKQKTLPTPRLWPIDEFGVHQGMTRHYARSPRGKRAEAVERFHVGPNISVISALTLKGVRAPMMIEGAIDTEVLERYVEHFLVPLLQPGDIVIWDNVAIHKNARIRARIEATGARIEPLPAYSPDLNPIEECISKIKNILRTLKAETIPALWRALKYAFAQITPQDIRGWFQHCGYVLT